MHILSTLPPMSKTLWTFQPYQPEAWGMEVFSSPDFTKRTEMKEGRGEGVL